MIKDYEEDDLEKVREDDSTDYMSFATYLVILCTQLEIELERIIKEAVKKFEYKENDKVKLKEYLQAKKERESNAKKKTRRKRQSHK